VNAAIEGRKVQASAAFASFVGYQADAIYSGTGDREANKARTKQATVKPVLAPQGQKKKRSTGNGSRRSNMLFKTTPFTYDTRAFILARAMGYLGRKARMAVPSF